MRPFLFGLRVPVTGVICAGFVSIVTAGSAFGAPARGGPGLTVSAGAGCRVSLTKVSYDDPGADDAELVELFVDRVTGSAVHAWPLDASSTASGDAGGLRALCDAMAPLPASRDAASEPANTPPDSGMPQLTLSDCGLAALELVDGAGNACGTYRSIPLGAVPVPGDGYVVLCAVDSALAAAGRCDVMAAGRSALKNGWLQNGPSDGLRFVGTGVTAAVAVGYEQGPSCFAPSPVLLVDEAGAVVGANGAPEDDVNVFCDPAFVLLGAHDAPLRRANPCPREAAAADAGLSAADPHVAADGGAVPSERTPSRTARGASSPLLDAGLVAVPRRQAASPKVPGCSVARPGLSRAASPVGLWPALAVGLYRLLTRRTRRTPRIRGALPPPRRGPDPCGSFARSGSSRRRSPSRSLCVTHQAHPS